MLAFDTTACTILDFYCSHSYVYLILITSTTTGFGSPAKLTDWQAVRPFSFHQFLLEKCVCEASPSDRDKAEQTGLHTMYSCCDVVRCYRHVMCSDVTLDIFDPAGALCASKCILVCMISQTTAVCLASNADVEAQPVCALDPHIKSILNVRLVNY